MCVRERRKRDGNLGYLSIKENLGKKGVVGGRWAGSGRGEEYTRAPAIKRKKDTDPSFENRAVPAEAILHPTEFSSQRQTRLAPPSPSKATC